MPRPTYSLARRPLLAGGLSALSTLTNWSPATLPPTTLSSSPLHPHLLPRSHSPLIASHCPLLCHHWLLPKPTGWGGEPIQRRQPRLQLKQQPEPPLQSLCILFISLIRFQLCFLSLFIVSLQHFDFDQISSMFSLNSACFHKHMLHLSSSHCMVSSDVLFSRLYCI